MGLVREYRTRLSAVVVTGKVGVRTAAARPDEAEDAQPLDLSEIEQASEGYFEAGTEEPKA